MAMLEMVSGPVPLLVIVAVLGLHVWFTCVSGNASDAAESVSWARVVPVPLKLTVCGLPAALSMTETDAERLPAAVGVNAVSYTHLTLPTICSV